MLCLLSIGLRAQEVDTVSLGAGYAEHVWYSLEAGEQARAAKSDWDIAFSVSGFGSSLLLNHLNDNSLWTYPNGDTANWSNIDTSGIGSWKQLYNSDTSWAYGAFSDNTKENDDFDLGWGVYNMITHQVQGDSLFVLKHQQTYKKVWIVSLAGGVFTVRMANLDGSDERTLAFDKNAYSSRNFAYYSIEDDVVRDLEPNQTSWDLKFTQYTTIIPSFGGYPASGVLQNGDVTAAQVSQVADPLSFDDFENELFSTEINTIGHDWKSFDFATNQWAIDDSTVYFVRARNGALWRVVFTDFGGSATGTYVFQKTLIEDGNDSPQGLETPSLGSLQVYPNPSNQGWTNLIYSSNVPVQLSVHDLQGRVVYSAQQGATELGQIPLSTQAWSAGMYIVRLEGNGTVQTEKLIIN
jgi:hypothetical protein